MSASSASPSRAQELMQRAANLQRAGRPQQALETLQEIIRLEPNHYQALCALGSLAAAAGQTDAALHYVERASQSREDGFESLALLAQIHQQREDPSAAAAAMQKAVALQPDNDRIHFNLGVLSEQLDDFTAARAAYGRAVSLNDGNLEAKSNLAMLSLSTDPQHALKLLSAVHHSRRGTPEQLSGNKTLPNLPDQETLNSKFKLQMDLEQLTFLQSRNELPDYVADLPDALQLALEDLSDVSDDNESFRRQHPKHHWKSHWQVVNRWFNRTIHLPSPIAVEGPLVNPDLDVTDLEQRYKDSDPQLVVVDDFLTPDALAALQDFCRRATIWHDLRRNYLGAYITDGFANALTLGIANELRQAMPSIFKDHSLTQAWGYKYGAALSGIGMHADAAAVNCNFWITEDEANMDPDSGGLLVYDKQAPLDWSFDKFNNDTDAMLEHLGESVKTPTRVAHRANRIVIFNSNLFHRTDDIHFRDDFLARRYNITLLYGRRGKHLA